MVLLGWTARRECPGQANDRDRRQISDCQGLGEGETEDRLPHGVMKMS